jgi:uncharacterized membrane protein YhhN
MECQKENPTLFQDFVFDISFLHLLVWILWGRSERGRRETVWLPQARICCAGTALLNHTRGTDRSRAALVVFFISLLCYDGAALKSFDTL